MASEETEINTEELHKKLLKLCRGSSWHALDIFLKENPEVIELLSKEDAKGLRPIHHAAYLNKNEIVRYLIEQQDTDVNVKTIIDQTPLHLAALRIKSKKKNTISGNSDKLKKFFGKKLLKNIKSADINDLNAGTLDDDDDYMVDYEDCDKLEEPPAAVHEKDSHAHGKTEAEKKDHTNEHFTQCYHIDDFNYSPDAETIKKLSPKYNESFHETIFLLQKLGGDIDAADTKGLTPLLIAVNKNNEDATLQLIKLGCSINAKDKSKQNALHITLNKNFENLTRILLYQYIDLLVYDTDNNSPLHLGARSGSFKSVKLYLACLMDRVEIQKFYIILDEVNKYGYTSLHLALMANAHSIVRLLVANGAHLRINTKYEKNTPLHLAVKSGCAEMTKFLVNEGISVLAKNNIEDMAVHLAAQNDDHRVLEFLLTKNAAQLEARDRHGMTPYLLAIIKNNTAHMKVLVDAGADEFVKDASNRTNIFLAAMYNSIDVLEILLKDERFGNYITQPDYENNSPIHIALEKRNYKALAKLAECSTDLSLKNDFGRNPIHIAAEIGTADYIKCLKLDKDNVNAVDEMDETPMHIAASSGNLEVFKYLVENDGDINSPNYCGFTPLSCAVAKGHESIVNYILNKGVPCNPDRNSIPPLHVACRYGKSELVSKLLKLGAEPCLVIKSNVISIKDGSNALDIAIDFDHKECAREIIWSPNAVPKVLKNRIKETRDSVTSPMRKLIKFYPDLAKDVLDWSIRYSADKNELIYDFELLDDSYSPSFSIHYMDEIQPRYTEDFDEDGNLTRLSQLYDQDPKLVFDNHVLRLMVEEQAEELLEHPLTRTLTDLKWKKSALALYSLQILLFMMYLIFFNTFLLMSIPPYTLINETYSMHDFCNDSKNYSLMNVEALFAIKILLLVIISIALIIELLNFAKDVKGYLLEVDNLFQWFVFISTVIAIIDTSQCSLYSGVRKPWQWELATITLLCAWMSFILFLKKLPYFGMYILLFTNATKTFLEFSTVFFLIISTFSISFMLVLSHVQGFSNFRSSIMRVMDMAAGEIDVTGIFFDKDQPVIYKSSAYIVLLSFMILVKIVLINLTVGLAFSDIRKVMTSAKVTREALKINLCLDLEYYSYGRLKNRGYKKFLKHSSADEETGVLSKLFGFMLCPVEPDFQSPRWTQEPENNFNKDVEKLADESAEMLIDINKIAKVLETNSRAG